MLTGEFTEAEHAERRKGVGASEAARVWAGEWFSLWQEKVGEATPKKIMSDWQRALRAATETLQLDWYEHENPSIVSRRGEVAVSVEYPFMRCTLDGWVEHLHVPINAKHLSKWTKEAREWAIEHYTPQIVHEAIVTGADYGLISLLHGEKEPEIIRIDCEPMFAAELIAKEREFWGFVERREPPPDAPPQKVPMLASELRKLRTVVVPIDEDGVFEAMVRQENWLPEACGLITKFAGTLAAATAHNITREDLKGIVPEDVGVLERGLFKFSRTRAGAIRMSLGKGEDDGA